MRTHRLIFACSLALAPGNVAAAECSTANFAARITEQLGYDPSERDPTLRVEVGVDDEHEGLHGRVRIVRAGVEEGQRELRAATSECEELLRALASTAATAIDPTTVMMRQANIPAQPAEPTPPVAQATAAIPAQRVEVAPPVERQPETTPIPIRFEVDARGGFVIDALPANAGTLELNVGMRIGDFSILAEGSLAFGGWSDTRNGHRSRGDSVAGGLALCLRETVVAPVSVLGCVAGLGGVIFGASDTVSRPLTHSSTFALMDARLGVGFALSDSFMIEPLFRVQVPLIRTTFLIDGNPAWSASAFAFGAALNLSAAL